MTTLKNKGGRPKKIVTADQLPLIEQMASEGKSVNSIARVLGFHDHNTFDRCRRDQPEVGAALDHGRALEHDRLVSTLEEACIEKKNIVACMFLLKTRHQYVEGGAPAQGSGVTVNITLPGAMSPDQYAERVVNGTEIKRLPE